MRTVFTPQTIVVLLVVGTLVSIAYVKVGNHVNDSERK